MGIFVTSCFLCSFAGLVHGQGLSKKARKLAQTNLDDNFPNAIFEQGSTTTTTTEDPFADFESEFEETEVVRTEDPFFSFDDDPFFNGGEIGPVPCTEFSMPGDNCQNTTVVVPEIRHEDPIFNIDCSSLGRLSIQTESRRRIVWICS